jgi:nucleoid-associated protein YgaU
MALLGNIRRYTVRPGDRLSDVALMFYGDARKIGPIFQANRLLIEDPNQLNIGIQLLIPHIPKGSF